MNEVYIRKLNPRATTPRRATTGSAGYDLYACLDEAIWVEKNAVVQIPTGIALGIEDCRYAAFVYARSGLATKSGVIPANCVGVIDSDYRGEVMVALTNFMEKPFMIQPGDRIAQLVFSPVVLPDLIETEELEATERGIGGFGSTGICGATEMEEIRE